MSAHEAPIVLLGPKGATFTYQAYDAIAKIFDAPRLNGNIIEVARNGDVLNTLMRQPNAFGLIAAETRVGGRVTESHEAFVRLGSSTAGEAPMKIIGAATVPLSFALMSKGVPIGDIEGVVAHPQALAACSKGIDAHGWRSEDSTSNGRAAQDVSNVARYERFAALGPIEAADKYGLTVLDPNFEKGLTTFFLLSSGTMEPRIGASNRALIVFRTKGGCGALVDALKPFKRQKINLIHIHSVHDVDGVYDFVAEAECDGNNIGRMEEAFRLLREATQRCTIFGPFEIRLI